MKWWDLDELPETQVLKRFHVLLHCCWPAVLRDLKQGFLIQGICGPLIFQGQGLYTVFLYAIEELVKIVQCLVKLVRTTSKKWPLLTSGDCIEVIWVIKVQNGVCNRQVVLILRCESKLRFDFTIICFNF